MYASAFKLSPIKIIFQHEACEALEGDDASAVFHKLLGSIAVSDGNCASIRDGPRCLTSCGCVMAGAYC